MTRYSNLKFKYKTIKDLRNRAIDLRDRSNNKEGWNEVITWLNTFLDPKYRTITKNGAIGLDINVKDYDLLLRNR